MTDIAPRMVPQLDDLNRDFWTGGAEGELRITRCTSCERWVFPLSRTCDGCGGTTAYQAVSGRGTVFTYTVNRHPYSPGVPLPYVIALVELAEQEGLRFMTNIVGCEPDDVSVEMPVQVAFEQHGETWVPVFAPA